MTDNQISPEIQKVLDAFTKKSKEMSYSEYVTWDGEAYLATLAYHARDNEIAELEKRNASLEAENDKLGTQLISQQGTIAQLKKDAKLWYGEARKLGYGKTARRLSK